MHRLEWLFLKRRDTTRVIYEILILAARGSTKTRIVHGANLNFRLAERYLSFLLGKQLLTTETVDDSKVYRLTEGGERMLRFLREVEKELIDLPLIQARQAAAPNPPLGNERAVIEA